VGKWGEEMKVTWRGGGEAVATVRSDVGVWLLKSLRWRG
jgi:hypothetical protein